MADLENERLAAETRKFIAEHDKLSAEREKLFQEALKMQRERAWLVPLAVLSNGALAAVIGAVVAYMLR